MLGAGGDVGEPLKGADVAGFAVRDAVYQSQRLRGLRSFPQRAVGGLATGAYNTGDFQSAFRVMNDLDSMAGRLPATIQSRDGVWVMFEDFYRDARREGLDDRAILNEWLSEADQARRN